MESMEDSVVPKRLSYQGLLTKANGQPVSDGDYQIIFKLFDSKIDGSFFWEESQIVSINDGLINIILGANTPIEKVPNQAYLEIDIDGTVLSPRQEMTSVFYAMVSDTSKYSQGGDYLDLDNRPDLSIYSKKDTLGNYALNSSLDSVAFSDSPQAPLLFPIAFQVQIVFSFNASILETGTLIEPLLEVTNAQSPS